MNTLLKYIVLSMCMVTVSNAKHRVNLPEQSRGETPLAVAYQLAQVAPTYRHATEKLITVLGSASRMRGPIDVHHALEHQRSFEKMVKRLIDDVIENKELKAQFSRTYLSTYKTNEEYWHALRAFKQALKTYKHHFMRKPSVDGERPEVVNVLWEFNATMLGAVEISWSMWAQGLTEDTIAQLDREHWVRNVVVAGVVLAGAWAAQKYCPDFFADPGNDANKKQPDSIPQLPRKNNKDGNDNDTAPSLVPGNPLDDERQKVLSQAGKNYTQDWEEKNGESANTAEQDLREQYQDVSARIDAYWETREKQSTPVRDDSGKKIKRKNSDDLALSVPSDDEETYSPGGDGDMSSVESPRYEQEYSGKNLARVKREAAERRRYDDGDISPTDSPPYDPEKTKAFISSERKLIKQAEQHLGEDDPVLQWGKALLGGMEATQNALISIESEGQGQRSKEKKHVQDHLNDSEKGVTNISNADKRAFQEKLDELERQGGATENLNLVDQQVKDEQVKAQETQELMKQVAELKRQHSDKKISTKDLEELVRPLNEQLTQQLRGQYGNTGNSESTENTDG